MSARTTAAALALVLGSGCAVVWGGGASPAAGAEAAPVVVPNACATAYDDRHHGVELAWQATAGPAVGGVLTIDGLTVQFALSDDAALAAYDAGLVPVGTSQLALGARAAVRATLAEVPVHVAVGAASASVTIVDPDGTPGTGDETASAIEVVATLGSVTWQRAGAGEAAVAQAAAGSLPVLPAAGQGNVDVAPVGSVYLFGPLSATGRRVTIDCRPGSVGPDGAPLGPVGVEPFVVVPDVVTEPTTPTTAPHGEGPGPVPTTEPPAVAPPTSAPAPVPAAHRSAPTGDRGLATTGLSPTTARNVLLAVVLLDLGYLLWSTSRPASRAARGRGRAG